MSHNRIPFNSAEQSSLPPRSLCPLKFASLISHIKRDIPGRYNRSGQFNSFECQSNLSERSLERFSSRGTFPLAFFFNESPMQDIKVAFASYRPMYRLSKIKRLQSARKSKMQSLVNRLWNFDPPFAQARLLEPNHLEGEMVKPLFLFEISADPYSYSRSQPQIG